MRVRTLDEIAQEHPKFTPGWTTTPDRIYNPKFGEVKRVVVCKDDGTPIWDQYQLVEKPGAIVVPFYHSTGELHIGLVQMTRPLVADPTGKQGDVTSYEVPRGGSNEGESSMDTAKRELGEETETVAKHLRHIGDINYNTAFYVTSVPVYAAEINLDEVSRFKPDATEKILQAKFYTPKAINEMVMSGDIFCAMTQASLLRFYAHVAGFSPKQDQAAAQHIAQP